MKTLLFASILILSSFSLSAQILEIQTMTGKRIQVANFDFEDKMTWEEAKKACEGLGKGWRLPNTEELRAIYLNLFKKEIGNFESVSYWSSEEYEQSYAYYYFFNKNGVKLWSHKLNENYVRAVRSL